MSIVYFENTVNRPEFVTKIFELESIGQKVKDKTVLVKPNMVSFEPYPTTTHPETVQTVVKLLRGHAKRVVVGDGKAFDCTVDMAEYPLAKLCRDTGVEFLDISKTQMQKVQTQSGFDLELSTALSEFDFIISLPVLKYNFSTGLTGTLKNQYGFLSNHEKEHLHHSKDKDIHKAIAELSRVRKPDFYIVDVVQTMICAQEKRHGGKPTNLGCMVAGVDPVSLDAYGFEILKTVEKKLRPMFRKSMVEQVLHLKYAADFGVGSLNYKLKQI